MLADGGTVEVVKSVNDTYGIETALLAVGTMDAIPGLH